jgi:hypothetical protein
MHTHSHRSFLFICVHLCASVVPLLLLAGCEPEIKPERAVQLMHDPTSADARRTGVAAQATRWSFGKLPPYPGYYQQIAQSDPDYTVRAMAIRALNLCRDQTATRIFINGLKDENELVRLESAKALVNVPDPDAVNLLMATLAGERLAYGPGGRPAIVAETMDVRIAAADALKRYRDLKNGRAPGMPEPTEDATRQLSASIVVRTLAGHLNDLDFGIAWQARQSLITITGQDFHYDEAAWLQYLAGPVKPFG